MTQKKDEAAEKDTEAAEAPEKTAATKTKAAAKTKAKPKPKPAAKPAQAKRVTARKAEPKEAEAASEPAASEPAEEPKTLDELVEDLNGANRRRRQDASHELALRAKEDPEAISEVIPELIDALYRPEAQTRWEALNALADLAGAYGKQVEDAYDGAEASLFDEDSATVRLAAFHFLASYGATSPARSDSAWPLLDEAIQCYHGDSEYRDMLGYLLEFASGEVSPESRKAMVSRISFDAENGRGYVKTCSADIIKASKAAARSKGKKAAKATKASKPKAKKAASKSKASTKAKASSDGDAAQE